MAAFEYRQAQEIRDAFHRHGCRYLFIGKSGAILLGYPDTTQDVDVFVELSPANPGRNGRARAPIEGRISRAYGISQIPPIVPGEGSP